MPDANAALMEAAPASQPNAIAARERSELTRPDHQGGALLDMLRSMMLDPQLSIERINQTFDFYQRVEQAAAKRAFTEAKAAFKANAPTIVKDMENTQYKSRYSSIGNVVGPTNEALSKHGLDASWEFDQGDKSIKITCILTHARGHSERVTLSGPPDVSGSKNPIQQIKSTTTYLKLATYEAVTGIASEEGNTNDDGNAAANLSTISEEQSAKLQQEIVSTNAHLPKFLAYFKIERIDAMPASRFDEAMSILDDRRSKTQ